MFIKSHKCFWSSCLEDILSLPFCSFSLYFFFLMRCADVHETLSIFSDKNVYGFINLYIFVELFLYFNKNSVCFINIHAYVSDYSNKKIINYFLYFHRWVI